MTIIYFILAAFGLGLLVFIHELGHYFMARRVGMRVEAFGIGFGKPIYTWEHKGVKWNFCWLPFGGYVRIAGMEKEKGVEPSQIPDGFFGKSPGDRIKVAIMGPLVNIVFALFLFSILWMTGGREKSFSEFTHIMGWIDSDSALYNHSVRPGDEITQYNHHAFKSFDDLRYAALLKEKQAEVAGYKINYKTGFKEPFDYSLETYQDPYSLDPAFKTIGIFSPARYLVYDSRTPLYEDSPMKNSGIQNQDRIIAVDGQLIFSNMQLSHVINEPKALLTIKRGGQTLLARIPRLKISDIKLTEASKAEINDWEHEASLIDKVSHLYFIPYSLTHNAVVENEIVYLDQNAQDHLDKPVPRSYFETTLQKGDRVIAVDGTPVSSASDALKQLQQRTIQIIVERQARPETVSWKDADKTFIDSYKWSDLEKIISTMGTQSLQKQAGNYVLLNPITPKPVTEFAFSQESKSQYSMRLSERKQMIESIKNPEERAQALNLLEEDQKKLILGFYPVDLSVSYNPSPVNLSVGVFEQMVRTIKSLVTGQLSPKWMSGPVGIVQVFHYGWSVGVKEALFWIGVISLNLGLVNLLPLPVLDGGHILFALVEKLTGKPLSSKTMEKLVVPFVVLIIGAFIYFTYNDLSRLFGKFF